MFIACVKLNNVLTFNHYKADPYCCTHDFSKLFELCLLNLRKTFVFSNHRIFGNY